MTEAEIQQFKKSGAVAGLCPTTEANLGDGLFPLAGLTELSWGIGSDSHVSVNMIEELRWLEYGQRLFHQQRIMAKTATHASSGPFLYQKALSGGAMALGRKTGSIEKGMRADFIAIDRQHPSLSQKPDSDLLDAMIFATSTNPIRHVVAGGRHVVKDFRHIAENDIYADYCKTLARLADVLITGR